MFADHIGNLTVELVLASAEVRHKQQTMLSFSMIRLCLGDNIGEKEASIIKNTKCSS